MPIMNLIRTEVEKAPYTSSGEVLYYDIKLKGFGLRVSQSKKTFFAESRVNGKTRRVKLGTYEKGFTPEAARVEAKDKLNDMEKGIDPNARKRAAREQADITLQKCFEDYLEAGADLKPKSILIYKDVFKNCFKVWADRPLTDISRDMVTKKYREIGNKTPAYANLAMRLLRALYRFAADQHMGVPENPVSVKWYKIERRRTLVKTHDLPAFFDGLNKLEALADPRGAVTADYIRILLFTGLRRNEAAGIEWKDVDFKARTFTIPITKNGQPLTLPMSEPLLEIFRRRKAAAGKNENVFSLVNYDRPLADPRYGLDQARKLGGVTFTYHDLRRSFASIAEAEVSAYQLKRMLNHSQKGDVTAGYIVSDAESLRDGMERVARKILNFAEEKAGKLIELSKKGK